MSSVVLVANRTCSDGYGKPGYGSATAYRAHLSRKRRMVRTAVGQEVVSEQAVYLAGSPAMLPSAQVTLSTADVGSTEDWAIHPTIQAIERRFDDTGPHHVCIYL